MTTLTTIVQNEQQIRKCIADTGFYMKLNDRSVQVDHIKNGSGIVQLPYDIVLKINKLVSDKSILEASLPTFPFSIKAGVQVYYAGLNDNGDIECHQGTILSVQKDDEDLEVFTINGPKLSEEPSPVFISDATNKTVNLIGVIIGDSPNNQAVHINLFKGIDEFLSIDSDLGEVRGGIAVKYEEFKGLELRKSGGGPRFIQIWGNSLSPVTYDLRLEGTNLNPHNDKNYNKDQATFYKNALVSFVEIYKQNKEKIPNNFVFKYNKESYEAKIN